jgi:hypothetical protein
MILTNSLGLVKIIPTYHNKFVLPLIKDKVSSYVFYAHVKSVKATYDDVFLKGVPQ